MKNKLILLPIIFVLLSCVSRQVYPDVWNPVDISQSGRCPDITGEYNNEGEDGHLPYKPDLFLYLYDRNSKYQKASHVSIRQSDEKNVEIIFLNKGQAISKRSLSADSGDFYCEDGFLKIKYKEFIQEFGIAGNVWYTAGFAKSGKDLILKQDRVALMMFLIFPVTGGGTSWYRFKYQNIEIE